MELVPQGSAGGLGPCAVGLHFSLEKPNNPSRGYSQDAHCLTLIECLTFPRFSGQRADNLFRIFSPLPYQLSYPASQSRGVIELKRHARGKTEFR